MKQVGLNRHHPELAHIAHMTFFVVYSKNTGRIRWYTRPEYAHEVVQLAPQPGCGVMELPMTMWGNHRDLQPLVIQRTGLVPKDDRYAIIHPSGKVVGAIFADLKLGDKVAGHKLIPHEHAGPGWWFNHLMQSFEPPLLVAAAA